MNELTDLHRELLVEHAQRPRHAVALSGVDVRAVELHHPTCNDHARVYVRLADEHIQAIGCLCSGCAITIASGSLMAERLHGVSLNEAADLYRAVRNALEHDVEPPAQMKLGEAAAVVGVRAFPLRVKCALLPWLALAHLLGMDHPNPQTVRAGSSDSSAPSRSMDDGPLLPHE